MKTSLRNIGPLLLSLLFLCSCVNVHELQQQKSMKEAAAKNVAVAMQYLRYDQPNQAKMHLAKALEQQPHSAMVQNGLAILYRYLQDPVREEEHLKQALSDDKHFSPARNNYGIMLTRQKRYEEAIEQFSAAAQDIDNDNSGLAYANMGRCYELMNENDKALWAYQKAVLLNSAGPEIFLNMATIYFRQKNYPNAEHYYKRYTKSQNPQGADGLWFGIQLANAMGDVNSRASYEMALKNLYPTSTQYEAWQKWSQAHGGN
jgi:type IV pilus assembly protein PilF